MSQTVFEGVYYYISETLPPKQREQLKEVLDTRGAQPVSSTSDPSLTHFITSSIPIEDFVEGVPEDTDVHIVTPRWVERSAILASLQDAEYYSADPAHLFSGVTAAATDLSRADCELMSAAITALGGQWRSALTRDVTHLFALAPGSAKYETAMHFKERTGVRILVPHWFDDTIRLGIRDLPTRNYEWPEPRVFQQRPEGRTSQEDVDYEPPPERMVLYSTASLSNEEQGKTRPAARNVWKGKRILLGLSLDLSRNQRVALSADIRRQGGEVVELSLPMSADPAARAREELEKLDEADIFVTRYRTGPAYAKAYKNRLTIGTLAWLWYVRATGTLTRPADQLLHYPIPDKPAEGFAKEVITVTNYTGKDREYLKKLITLMGGEFTASMSAERNTIVVAAYLHGTKTDKATSWSIPIVNHTWIEDCFVQWRRLTPAREKYIVFPPGVDFSTVLAERGLGRISWDPAQLEEMFRAAEAITEVHGHASPTSTKRVSASASPKKGPPAQEKNRLRIAQREDELAEVPSGTARSLAEVEEAVTVDGGERSLGGQMDVDDDFADIRKGVEQMDVDEEAGPSKPPSKQKGPPSKRAILTEQPSAEASSKRRLVRRFTPRNTDDEAESAAVLADIPSSKAPIRTYGSGKSAHAQGEDAGQTSPASSRSPAKKPPSRRQLDPDPDGDVAMEDPSEVRVRPKKDRMKKKGPPGIRVTKVWDEPSPAKSMSKPQGKHLELELASQSDSSDEEDVRSVLGDLAGNGRASRTNATRVSATDAQAGRSPARLDSVTVPTVESVYRSPTKRTAKGETSEAANAVEKDAPPKSTRNRAATTAKKVEPPSPSESRSPSPPPPPAKTSRKQKAVTVDEPAPDPSGPSTSSSPTKVGRTPSRRSAATKAQQKLHDVIMPDVISFQKELKKGTVKAAHELEKSASKGKARVDGELSAKGKKRPSMGSGDEDESEMPDKKKRKAAEVGGAVKGKKKVADAKKSISEPSEEPESQETGARRKSLAATASMTVRSEVKSVRVLTTQLSLGDDVVKTLTKLGVKFVTKPTECTHLLVKSVVRTEKFLCAMAVAPYVLSEKWAIASATVRKLMPEDQYMIKDPETEKKYGFTLTDALQRAKKNAGKLFAGKTFYVTPKVSVDSKLLKNVVTANGGQLSTQTPTVRILSGHDDRLVISCPEDVSIWRPLVEHEHLVYTQELILTSALRQELDLDDPGFLVPGSF
ncbi:hypothetical protein PYCCODRAFT_1382487 [Trametes coccinea BRFM310]|uniref:BRCT domain-containing protein n=1 Tax=Trametes coccinea (strain BRFM310) TaxID=1353009 RepID=A0A1Y2J1A1_TRAC3|nr:hypothetical protein PYCCODRAFT_1382487 [Trametes coccinea BRFM310]